MLNEYPWNSCVSFLFIYQDIKGTKSTSIKFKLQPFTVTAGFIKYVGHDLSKNLMFN